MPDLRLEVLHRNARLRAYQMQGVPVTGVWRYQERIPGRPRAEIDLLCGVCGTGARKTAWSAAELARAEGDAASFAGCSHLAPLLGVDSPEVKALLGLNLLEG